MSRTYGDLLGTLLNTFRIGRATLDASGLTAARAHALPDASGTIALTSDNPVVFDVTQVAHGLSVGMLVCQGAASWVAADRDADTTLADAIVSAVADADNFTVKKIGVVTLTTGQWDARTGDVGGLTKGSEYYLSSTAGGLTKTEPTTGLRQYVGKAISTTVLLLDIGEIFDLDAGGSGGAGLVDGDYGDVVVSGTGTIMTLDSSVVTAASRTLLAAATAKAHRETLELDTFERLYESFHMNDYYNSAGNAQFITAVSGSATVASSSPESGHPGIYRLSTGAAALQSACIYRSGGSSTSGWTRLNDGTTVLKWRVRFGQVTSAAQLSIARIGWSDNWTTGGSSGSNSIYIQYGEDGTGDVWAIGTRTGAGAVTLTNGTNAPSASTWYDLRLEINAAMTEAKLYVDEVLEVTATTGASWPATTTNFHYAAFIFKSAGTTAHTLDVDAVSMERMLT